MEQTGTSSIAIAPELMTAIEMYAQTAHKSVNAVAEEALRFFVDANPSANAIRRQHVERAAALGLELEDYVARMIKEWRREDREAERDAAHSS